MKFVIQRVTKASCTVEGQVTGAIDTGYCVFIGVCDSDTKKVADKMISKMIGLRIFPDENDKTNLSLKDVNGGLLLISQFTLYANCRKGNRPSFTDAGNPQFANEMYEYIIAECRKTVPVVQTGVFGAHMDIAIQNYGPFTIVLDSGDLVV